MQLIDCILVSERDLIHLCNPSVNERSVALCCITPGAVQVRLPAAWLPCQIALHLNSVWLFIFVHSFNTGPFQDLSETVIQGNDII